MYVNNGHKTHGQDIMYLKWREKKDTNNPHYIPQKSTLPLTKMSYTNSPPKNDYFHI